MGTDCPTCDVPTDELLERARRAVAHTLELIERTRRLHAHGQARLSVARLAIARSHDLLARQPFRKLPKVTTV